MKKSLLSSMFEILYRENYHRVYKSVLFFTRDKFITEEAVQQAFMIAFKKIESLSDKEKFASWVTVIAINEAKCLFKKYLNDKIVLFDEENIKGTMEHIYADVETKIDITNSFKKLKPLDAQILVLKFYADLSLEQISSIMNISEANVKVRLHRAKIRYRQLIGDSYEYQKGGEQ